MAQAITFIAPCYKYRPSQHTPLRVKILCGILNSLLYLIQLEKHVHLITLSQF